MAAVRGSDAGLTVVHELLGGTMHISAAELPGFHW
jgi:hypothetical protein